MTAIQDDVLGSPAVATNTSNEMMEESRSMTNDGTDVQKEEENRSLPESPSLERDLEFLREAEKWHDEVCYFKAAHCLKQIKDQSIMKKKHHRIIELADRAYVMMQEMMLEEWHLEDQHDWKKQAEIHGRDQRDTIIHYKVNKDFSLTSRIETVMESSLLVPLLAVFNESELFETWMPSWKHPFKMGVKESKKLGEYGRGHQIISVTMELPFPLCNRQAIQHAYATDTIDEDNAIMIKVNSMDTGHYYEIDIAEHEKGVKRIDLDVGILIRACPENHPLLKSSNLNRSLDEPLLLITTMMSVDARVSFIPKVVINFMTRTALSKQWSSLLHVAEDVREGKRPKFQEMIEKKEELYGWVEQRVHVMLQNLKRDEKAKELLEETARNILDQENNEAVNSENLKHSD